MQDDDIDASPDGGSAIDPKTAGSIASELRNQRSLDAMRVNPNPRLVALLNYAIDEVSARLHGAEYGDWLAWAASWKVGERVPGKCVDVANRCFAHKDQLIWHTLGQLAWGGKEACYSTKTGGWLVIRYIADAMCAFGVAFPDKVAVLLEAPIAPGNFGAIAEEPCSDGVNPIPAPTERGVKP